MDIKKALLLRSLIVNLRGAMKDSELLNHIHEFNSDTTRYAYSDTFQYVDHSTPMPRNRNERRIRRKK